MAGLKRFSYTGKDHDTIVNDCVSRIKETYGSELWNDFEEDNTGMVIIESFAFITDLLLYYLDRQANETYFMTATERQNLINQCKLTGYTPKNSSPALAYVTIYIDEPHEHDIILPAGTALETQSGVIFETSGEAIIKAGSTSTAIEATEGETFEEVIGRSDGSAWQSFYLPRSGVIGVLSITIDGHIWDCVESLADQTQNAEAYTVEMDAWRRAEISFGDGKTGRIPDRDENITVRYRIGGGIAGNVAPGTITGIRDIATDTYGDKVQVKAVNEEWASGGSEPESIESIKLNAPRFFETQNRCVTRQDYEVFASSFEGIAKTRAVVRERTGEANIIRLYVLSYGITAGTVTAAGKALKDSLLEYINKYKQLTDWIEIDDGKWRNINFSGLVIISDGFSANSVLENIRKALSALMNIEIRDMGEALRISDVYSSIDNIEGVLYVELNEPRQTIAPENNELLVLGDIDFTFKLKGSIDYGANF